MQILQLFLHILEVRTPLQVARNGIADTKKAPSESSRGAVFLLPQMQMVRMPSLKPMEESLASSFIAHIYNVEVCCFALPRRPCRRLGRLTLSGRYSLSFRIQAVTVVPMTCLKAMPKVL